MSRIKYFIPLLVICFVSLHAHYAHAGVSGWQKGFSIIPRSTTDFSSSSFQQSLTNLKNTGANYVTLIIPYYQDTINSTSLHPGSDTPTDESLSAGIDYAHSLGLAVNLNLHLESYDTNWRANINPSDRSSWFANYGHVLNHYAILAQQKKAEMYTLGAELIDMTSDNLNATNTENWLDLISTVRSLYTGKVTYDGNWGGGTWNDELDHIKFWDALDYIGVSAYYHIGGSTVNKYTAESLSAAWDSVNKNQLQALNSKYGKQILFTEVGFRSLDGALTHPASWEMGGSIDQQEQSDGYQSLFAYWTYVPYFAGVQFWDWSSNPNAGGPGDLDFTVQGKLAQQTVTNWFANNSNNPQAPSGKPVTYYVSDLPWKYQENGWGPVERDMSNGEQAAGDGKKITLNGIIYDKGIGGNAKSKIIFDLPQNCTTFTSDIGVDDEITAKGSVSFTVWRDETGKKIYDSGLLTYSSQTKAVSLDITGWKAIGLIIYDGGNGNGKDHGDWADAKISCLIPDDNPEPSEDPGPTPSPTPTPAPPSSAIINAWWPADGSTIGGTTLFKALLEGYDPGSYQMYWQVDGDVLNPMYDNTADGPHKEAPVDVSGWWWRNSGPYTITFVAKDLSGNVLATKDSHIYIQH